MLNFREIISATIIKNRGNTPKGSTPSYVSRSRSRCRRTGVRKAKELRQRCDELLTTLLTVKLEAQDGRFLSRSHHQTTSGPLESRNGRLHTKDRALKRLPPLMWTGGVLQNIPGSFIMWLPCSTIDTLGLSTSKHKSTPTSALLAMYQAW